MHCSKTTRAAFWVMACLARGGEPEAAYLPARAIARRQGLPTTFVAKILVQLSRAGLVRSVRGPHGGYRLARPPEAISLAAIAAVFEPEEPGVRCPLGDASGHGSLNCPLHASLYRVTQRWQCFLHETTLTVPAGRARDPV